jgi:hypothetical protein
MCAFKDDSTDLKAPYGVGDKHHPMGKYSLELIEALVCSIERLLQSGGYRLQPEGVSAVKVNPSVTLRARLARFSYEDLVCLVKELTAIPMAVALGADLPPVSIECLSDCVVWDREKRFFFLFPAAWGRFLKNRLYRSSDREAIWWAGGILALKKSMPDLRGPLVTVSLRKHADALTTEGDIRTIDSGLLEKVEQITRVLFPRGSCPTSWSDLVMATSSTVTTSRQRGGARGELLTLGARISPLDSELVDWVEGPLGGVVEVRGDPRYRDPLRVPLRTGPRGSKGFRNQAVDVVKATVVSDPLKARVVTSTHVERGLLKPFQQSLHKRLRQLPPFVLTGEWVQADHLNSRFGSKLKEGKGLCLNSGDFSAATDNVESVISRTIVRTMLEACYPENEKDGAPFHRFYQEALNSLTDNWIQYEGHSRRQVRGQLMGSLLSFPVLCVFNFCVWVISHYLSQYANHGMPWSKFLRQLGRKTFLKSLPVLINGDDILSLADKLEYGTWSDLVKRVGWSLSVGKSYLHPTVAVINSQIFRFTNGTFEHVVVFNGGLLAPLGQNRSSAWLGEKPPVDAIGELATQFLRGSKDPVASAGTFVSAHRNVLERSKRPLFLPKRLGGLGGKFPQLADFERWQQPKWVHRYARTCREEKFNFLSSSKTVREAERFTRAACENLLGGPLVNGETPEPDIEKTLKNLRGTIGRRSVPFPSWRGSDDRKIVESIRRRSAIRGSLPLSSRSIYSTVDQPYYLNRVSGGVKFALARQGLKILPLSQQDRTCWTGGLRGSQHVRFSEEGNPISLSVSRFGMKVELLHPSDGEQRLDLTPALGTRVSRPAFGTGGDGRVVRFNTPRG